MVTVAAMHAATANLGVPGHERPRQQDTWGWRRQGTTKLGVTSDSDGGRKEASPVPLVRTLTCTTNPHLASGLAS